MSSIRNYVHLWGNIGDDPKVTNLESGKKVARFSLATNENYTNAKGEKEQLTDWHTIVAWGKTAEIIENYAIKGKQLAIVGKLRTRSYNTEDSNKRYTTEVVVDEILLLGNKSDKVR